MAPECVGVHLRLNLEVYLENLNPLRPLQDLPKACNESWVQQLTTFDSWTLTGGILLSKVLFFINKRTRL